MRGMSSVPNLFPVARPKKFTPEQRRLRKISQSRKAVYRCPRCSGTLWGRAGQTPICGRCGTAYICYVGGIPLDAEAPSISSVPQESAIKSVPPLGGVPAQISSVPLKPVIKSVPPLKEITARDFAMREYLPPSLRPPSRNYSRS